MSDRWMLVRKDGKIPGGYRVVHANLTEDLARKWVDEYAYPHEAMSEADLYAIRLAAMKSERDRQTRRS